MALDYKLSILSMDGTHQFRIVLTSSNKSEGATLSRNGRHSGHLYFMLDIFLVKELSKHTQSTVIPGLKMDHKYAFLHVYLISVSFFFFFENL